jgi:uncharacterized protein (TIGR03545 family)
MAKEKKIKKKKGPLRTEAIIPALIFFLLVYGYFHFFFDGHLRRAAEYLLTQIHGAEVDIAEVRTSFLGASMEVKNIQITDKNHPERDLFRVGDVKFKALWDGLLRAKVVIDEASVLDIQALVPRKTPGRVLPPPPPSEGGVLAKAKEEILSQTRAQYQDNFLGDLAAVAGGVDVKDQLKNIQGDLKSSLRLQELDAQIKKKQEEWDQRLKNLPQAEYFKDLEKRFHALNWKEKDPVKFANNLKAANDLLKEAQGKIKEIDQAQKDLKGDLKTTNASAKDLEGFIQQDIKDLQQHFKIPGIDPKDFTRQFFMGQIEERLVSLRKYYEVAKKYMPPKKTAEEKAKEKAEALVPRKRGQGETFTFPITHGYPKFWLKKAKVSSTVSSSAEYSGNITGEILDVTSHPRYLKRPTRINLSGDFPKQKISGLDMKAVIDFTTDTPTETVDLKLAGFPMGLVKLSDSSDVKLNITPGKAALQLNAALSDGQILVDTQSQYNQVKYDIEAKQKLVQEILTTAFQSIPQLTLNARIQGPWDHLSINMNSNLGEELAASFKKQLEAKIAAAQEKIKAEVDQRIAGEKAKVQDQLKNLSADLEKRLGLKKGQADKALKDLQSGIEKQGNGLIKKEDVKKLEEKGKKLLKGLGF